MNERKEIGSNRDDMMVGKKMNEEVRREVNYTSGSHRQLFRRLYERQSWRELLVVNGVMSMLRQNQGA